MKECKLENCKDKSYCKDLCIRHYNRLKRHGDAETTTRFRNYFSVEDFIKNSDNILDYEFKDRTQWAIACKVYYGDKCSICNWNEATCDVNHIIEFKNGGKNIITNGEVLCPNHHSLKHRKPPLDKRKWKT